MKIDFAVLKQIDNTFGPMEVGGRSAFHHDESITLRFGYWKKVDVDKLNQLLPNNLAAVQNLVDEDDDCGELYNYILNNK